MNSGLLLEIGTILSVVAIVIPVMAATGMFKSRRHRELDAKLKRTLRQGSQSAGSALPPAAPRQAAPMPVLAATASAGGSNTAGGGGADYDPQLRSRAKAFDSAAAGGESVDMHSRRQTQRRYRRTRCIARNPSKTSCPRCGYLI